MLQRSQQKAQLHGSHALIKAMSLHRELSPGPSVYKTDALPLSYTGPTTEQAMHASARALLKAHLKPPLADSTQAPTLLPDAWSSTWPWDCSACAKVTAVRFEPTRFAPLELESTPLDHEQAANPAQPAFKVKLLICCQLAAWSSGMILASRGPGFNSQNSPLDAFMEVCG